MPEEKKKESFTFSDKIKNSKGAASKSFANRISSKIGNDGKPHQTLFERTKRDAPFLIAGLAALLMLPFLYKYSGQATEEPNMVTPAGDAMFDPTLRDAPDFDMITGDPSGQIAQLSGRDSMDLIRWGGSKEEEEEDEDQPLPMRSAPERSSVDKSASRRAASSRREEENNIRNIYKPRPAAPMARTAINRLNSSGLNNRGGGKLGVGMWGGNLKGAAQKVRAPKAVNSVKPVSLQPLQAAGKPSRSYFGRGNAAEARRSLDAMSKSNARDAIRDAQMNTVEPGQIGGMTFGAGGMPGGNGGLGFSPNHQAALKPWWWDEMQLRAHMDWERKFNYKWGWIDFATNLAQKFLDGFLSCMVTGTDDWSMGRMLGARAGSGRQNKCCGKKEKDIILAIQGQLNGGAFDEQSCKNYQAIVGKDKCPEGWEDGNVAKRDLGFFGTRLDCLSNGLGTLFDGDRGSFTGTAADCQHFAIYGNYTPTFVSTKGKDWQIFHYVVGIETGTFKKKKDNNAPAQADGNNQQDEVKLADALEEYYSRRKPEDQQKALTILYVGKGDTFNSNIEQVQNIKGMPLFVEFAAFKKTTTKKTKKGKDSYYWTAKNRYVVADAAHNGAENDKTAKDLEYTPNNKDTGTSYGDFLSKLRRSGYLVYDTYEADGTEVTKWERVKKGRMKKNRAIGGRCQFPLARISCDYYANAGASSTTVSNVRRGTTTRHTNGQKITETTETRTEETTIEPGLPYAHVTFWNGAQDVDVYNILKKRFMLSYVVQGRDNKDGLGITTSNDIGTSQWFKAPHEDVRIFENTWKTEDNDKKNHTLGHEREGNGKGFQIIATSDKIKDLRNNNDRVIITWEVRQCPDLEVDGSSISGGGCQNGLLPEGRGADRPGVIVSTATCVYNDGTDVWGSASEITDVEEIIETHTEDDKVQLAQTFTTIQDEYESRGEISFTRRIEDFEGCKIDHMSNYVVGSYSSVAKNKVNPQMLRYVNEVLTRVNADERLQKDNGGKVKAFKTYTQVSLSEFTDAMSLAYTLDSNAKIAKNIVCEIGKTIAGKSQDPDYPTMNNQFGAYAAYMGYDSSFFPARKDDRGNEDKRFSGCKGGEEQNCGLKYHYGVYNWNEKKLGDLDRGHWGRGGYEEVLDGKNPDVRWSTSNGFFPLQALADAAINHASFPQETATDAELASHNGTIDDVNREGYMGRMHGQHILLFFDKKACSVQGDMFVRDALDYLALVCKNGDQAKPENGSPASSCSDAYHASNVKGTN